MTQRIAVIIVNWNSGPLLMQCLTALERQTRVPERIIVVDNGSTDRSAAHIETHYPEVEVLRLAENIGFAAANNLAVRHAEGIDFVALLNPDAFPLPDWLEKLLVFMLTNPQYALVGCRLLDADNPSHLDGTGDIFHISGRVWRRDKGWPLVSGTLENGEIFSPCAAAALYRRDLFLKVGGFDESFFCYLEDVDLGFRLRLLGWQAGYAAEAVAYHVGSAITGRHSDFSLYYGHRNLVWNYVKNMPWPLLLYYLPQHLLLNLATLIYFSLQGRGRIILRSKCDALRGLREVWCKRRQVQAGRQTSIRSLRRVMERGMLTPYRYRPPQPDRTPSSYKCTW